MKKAASYVFSRITFKRLVILIILTLFALPIIKGVFFSSDEKDETFISADDRDYKYLKGNKYSDNTILVVPIQGVILTESSSVPNPLSFLEETGLTYGYDVKDTLQRAAEEDRIKAVLLEINSPGGTIPGSKAIADGVEYYKKTTGNPVYAHIRDVGASGAYWAAVATDKIIVDVGSMVGSIGVLMGPFKYYNSVIEEGSILGGVTTKDGIETTYFTAGQYKDTGSPYRRLTDEEKAHWQNMLNQEYDVFVNHVSTHRNLDANFIKQQVKALPYGSQRAKDLGLVDQLGNEEDAINEILLKIGVSADDYQLLYEKERTDIFSELLGIALKSPAPKVQSACQLCNTPLYLYDSTYNFVK